MCCHCCLPSFDRLTSRFPHARKKQKQKQKNQQFPLPAIQPLEISHQASNFLISRFLAANNGSSRILHPASRIPHPANPMLDPHLTVH